MAFIQQILLYSRALANIPLIRSTMASNLASHVNVVGLAEAGNLSHDVILQEQQTLSSVAELIAIPLQTVRPLLHLRQVLLRNMMEISKESLIIILLLAYNPHISFYFVNKFQ